MEAVSDLFKSGVAFDQFFRAPIEETDREASIITIALDPDHRAQAKVRMADVPTEYRVSAGNPQRFQKPF